MSQSNHSPKLTVLMAVHNGSLYLREAVDSILKQSYSHFYFLIVDDASTDDTRAILSSYNDSRIQVKFLSANVGQTAALNVGLGLSRTPWIARMDADDYSSSTRLEEQMQLLESNPSVQCVGTHIWNFRNDPNTVESLFTPPHHHAEIEHSLLRGSSIVHGTIVVNRKLLLEVGGYDERYRITADLELYDRLANKCVMANIPKALVGIREHGNQGSRSKLAYDEAIEICQKRLDSNRYTKADRSVIRSTLSRCYIFRARLNGRTHAYIELVRDLIRAARISPNTFLWNLCLVSVFDRLSKPRQAAIRRALANTVPKFISGR